jgi:hypothetical protein
MRDIRELGHCNFQFYDNAAGHYFSPAALLVCRQWRSGFAKAKSRRQSTSTGQRITWVFGWAGDQSGLPLEVISTIARPSALCSPTAALGGRDIVMRLELQALPKAVGGKADQNKPADDHQTLHHGYWTLPSLVRFNHEGQKQSRREASVKVRSSLKWPDTTDFINQS